MKWGALLFNLAVAMMFSAVTGIAPGYCTAGSLAIGAGLSLAPQIGRFAASQGFAMMAIQKEIWEGDIVEGLRTANPFLQYAFNADQYVLAGKVVHIPQVGVGGDVVKNRTSLPATVKKRTDTDITYPLDEFTGDPMLIPHADTIELSYDKRQSVTQEARRNLYETVAMELLYEWMKNIPARGVIPTSGAAAAATAQGATGTRKVAMLADLQKARTMLATQNAWVEGEMFALVPSSLLAQLFPANDTTTAIYFTQVSEQERRAGIMARVQGFQLLERSTVAYYDNAGALKAPGAASATTDSEAIFCWNRNAVERALGEVKMFESVGEPTYYGDIYSFLMRMGGRNRRADNKGIVSIIQAT